jgi:hypothetical protein
VLDVRVETAIRVGDELLRVGLEVAVGVLHQPEIRRLANQDTMIEHRQRARKNESVREDRPLVHRAVVVGVFEDDDSTDRIVLPGRLDVVHITRHLDDPEAAVGIPVDDDRILNERLARDQLETVTRRHVDRRELLRGRTNRRFIGDGLYARRPDVLRLKTCTGCRGGHQEQRRRQESGWVHADSIVG